MDRTSTPAPSVVTTGRGRAMPWWLVLALSLVGAVVLALAGYWLGYRQGEAMGRRLVEENMALEPPTWIHRGVMVLHHLEQHPEAADRAFVEQWCKQVLLWCGFVESYTLPYEQQRNDQNAVDTNTKLIQDARALVAKLRK